MRIENFSKRLIVTHEDGEQRQEKQFCSVINEGNVENREEKEKKMLMQTELRIELDEV